MFFSVSHSKNPLIVMHFCVVNDEDMQIVSWGELIIGLFVSGVIWYGYVLLKYYPELFKRKLRSVNSQPVKWVRENKTDQHAQVHELMEELKLIFAAAVRDELMPEQVKEAIAVRLKKHSLLKEEIKLSINQHIVNEFSLQLKISLTKEEINSLWK